MSLVKKIEEIAENSQNSDKIDVLKVSNICNETWSENEIQQTVSMLLNMMMNPQKFLICLELLQYMISMCRKDVIEILCKPQIISEFEQFYQKCSHKSLKEDILKFIENIAIENKNNSKYKNFVSMYYNLKPENRPQNVPSSGVSYPQTDTFEDDIQRAIKLSLETAPLQKIVDPPTAPIQYSTSPKPTKFIQGIVLFDFVAEEPGELSIKSGEIVTIIEKSNDSWWKGQIGARVGLFPSNFVKIKDSQESSYTPVDENMLNKCLNALLDADPLCAGQDEEEIKRLEDICKKMKIQITERLQYLKDQQVKYVKMDKEYNELILSYNQLFETSRNQKTSTNPPQPVQNEYAHSATPYYGNPPYQYPSQYPPQQPQNPPYNYNFDPNNPYNNQWNYR